eukprot:COSAG02_NODE_24318_length_692_cov_0.834739_1_plen_111_part_01
MVVSLVPYTVKTAEPLVVGAHRDPTAVSTQPDGQVLPVLYTQPSPDGQFACDGVTWKATMSEHSRLLSPSLSEVCVPVHDGTKPHSGVGMSVQPCGHSAVPSVEASRSHV